MTIITSWEQHFATFIAVLILLNRCTLMAAAYNLQGTTNYSAAISGWVSLGLVYSCDPCFCERTTVKGTLHWDCQRPERGRCRYVPFKFLGLFVIGCLATFRLFPAFFSNTHFLVPFLTLRGCSVSVSWVKCIDVHSPLFLISLLFFFCPLRAFF